MLDDRGEVVTVVTRDEMRARNLRHRSVYIAVLDGDRLLVHRHADWKDVWPSHFWCTLAQSQACEYTRSDRGGRPACVVVSGPGGLDLQLGYAPDGPGDCQHI